MSNKNINRRKSLPVKVGNVIIGGDNPIVIQSMTDTNTSDIEKTTEQIIALSKAGSEVVRVTVNDSDAIKAIPFIRDRLQKAGENIPIVVFLSPSIFFLVKPFFPTQHLNSKSL